jgi:hypothetical protein
MGYFVAVRQRKTPLDTPDQEERATGSDAGHGDGRHLGHDRVARGVLFKVLIFVECTRLPRNSLKRTLRSGLCQIRASVSALEQDDFWSTRPKI